MKAYFAWLKSDTLKLKRDPFLLLHILIPLIGAFLFLAYASIAPGSRLIISDAYVKTVGIAFPTLIGVACSMAAQKEYEAGNYQHILASPSRLVPFASKMTMLLGFGAFGVLLAMASFGGLLPYVEQGSSFPFGYFMNAAAFLFVGSVFIYFLLFYISLRFGKAASIGLGVMISLLSALLLTGLGEGIWPFVPFAWSTRFAESLLSTGMGYVILPPAAGVNGLGFCLCFAGTLILVLLLGTWVCRWDGARSAD
ncbi:lantibiotic immunity ABC transporter MutG family permease subunit [Paenibacillus sp. S-38]|uniref:lantibiotic immunity ABC transporter MutG family permease subunit n=1 Tax=Paenibacillus sp. S-38 TaxID=3416710 RepID=UPI003CF62999